MKLTRFALICGTLIAAGCGDDDSGGDDTTCGDGTTLVGGTCVADDVDAGPSVTCGTGTMLSGGMCVPTAVAPPVDYDSDEGGEVRVEYIRHANGTGVGTRTTAFFFKNSGTTKYFNYLNQNGCTDMKAGGVITNWPMALNTDRTYEDVGPHVVLTGGPTPLVVNKNTTGSPALDPFARAHGANNWYADTFAGTDTDGGTFLAAARSYDVTLPGSATFPGAFFDNAIYMPADFALIAPGNTTTAIPLPNNTPQTFTWQDQTETPPAGVEVLSLLAFTNATLGPLVICVEPNDGSITVPAAMIDAVRGHFPNGATIARQTLTHQVREMVDSTGRTGKRIDFLGVWCYAAQPFSVPAPI